MKKIIIFSFLAVIFIFILILVASVIISYKVIRPKTNQLNIDLAEKFSKIIAIPQKIHAPQFSYYQTNYHWDMQTAQNEQIGIDLKYNPAISKNEDTIILTLNSPPGSDPSIYRKVLPAIIVDPQSLSAAQDPPHANLNANSGIGYSKINLSVDQANQTTKISWEFKKQNLGDQIRKDYESINKLPSGLLKVLFPIPDIVIAIFKG